MPFKQYAFQAICLSINMPFKNSMPFKQYAFQAICLSNNMPFKQYAFQSLYKKFSLLNVETMDTCIHAYIHAYVHQQRDAGQPNKAISVLGCVLAVAKSHTDSEKWLWMKDNVSEEAYNLYK
jgi:hypothetical protein